MQYLTVRDQKIHYTYNEADGKPLLVLLHGAGGNTSHFPSILRRNTEFSSLAIDLPGHGKSEGAALNSIDLYTEFLNEFILQKNLKNFFLVGHSMGGLISQNYILKYDHSAAGLVLMSTGASLPVMPLILSLTKSDENQSKTAELITKIAYAKGANDALKKIGQRMLEKTSALTMNSDFSACNAADMTKDIARMKLPVLILCGDEDKMTPPKYSYYLAENIPGSELNILPNTGHMAALESPDAVLEIIMDWLKRQRG
ncbi:MAG TPA: alpha/beta hydrolase [Leptospiraceae bacterium]|nr:alpha/beta hydrolase [Leptospiraceae bacterium]HNN02246.1 alpha/beta hydrolase [Leptospiraceae bacterium]